MYDLRQTRTGMLALLDLMMTYGIIRAAKKGKNRPC